MGQAATVDMAHAGSSSAGLAPRPALSLAVPPEAARQLDSLPILARLPELNIAPSPLPAAAATSGPRLINQAWSRRLLIGGGAALVLLALSPLAFKRKGPAVEKPTWQPVPSSPSAAMPSVPPASPAATPASTMPRPADAVRLPSTNEPANKASTSTADMLNSAVQTAPQTGANTSMMLQQATALGDPRAPLADRRMAAPPELTRPDLEPLQPGMARLEGIIEKPSLRTSYEPPRSTTY